MSRSRLRVRLGHDGDRPRLRTRPSRGMLCLRSRIVQGRRPLGDWVIGIANSLLVARHRVSRAIRDLAVRERDGEHGSAKGFFKERLRRDGARTVDLVARVEFNLPPVRQWSRILLARREAVRQRRVSRSVLRHGDRGRGERLVWREEEKAARDMSRKRAKSLAVRAQHLLRRTSTGG